MATMASRIRTNCACRGVNCEQRLGSGVMPRFRVRILKPSLYPLQPLSLALSPEYRGEGVKTKHNGCELHHFTRFDEQVGEPLLRPVFPAAFVVGVADDQRHRDGRFAVDHLLE